MMFDLFGFQAKRQEQQAKQALAQARQNNSLLAARVSTLTEDNDLLRHELKEVTNALRVCQEQVKRLTSHIIELEDHGHGNP